MASIYVASLNQEQKPSFPIVELMAPQNTVSPQDWVLPNRVGFPEWVYKTFHASKYTSVKSNKFIQQRLVRDFLQSSSPYRGILLYHGLGSGKTCSAIAATEGYAYKGSKVVVMLPASLAQNYLNELMSCGNLSRWTCVELKADDTKILAELKNVFHYSDKFIEKHGYVDKKQKLMQLWMPWIPKQLFEPSRCRIHNKNVRSLTSAERSIVDATIQDILPHLYHFIRYNGLTQKLLREYTTEFFKNSVVVIDEAHNFISQATHPGTLNYRLYQNVRAAQNCRVVLLSGTPAINNPFEIGTTINLLRGDIRVLELVLPVQASFPNTTEIQAKLQSMKNNTIPLDRYIDDVMTHPGQRKIRFMLLPHGYVRIHKDSTEIKRTDWGMSVDAFEKRLKEMFAPIQKARVLHYDAYPSSKEEFYEMFLDLQDPSSPKMKNKDLFMRRALGLVSFLKNVDNGTYPIVLPQKLVLCPMSAHQFESYEKQREEEVKIEKNKGHQRNADPFAKTSSVYRAFSRMACNFAFPKNINRPFPKDMRLARSQMDDNDDDNDEPKIKADKTYENLLEEALGKLTSKYLVGDKLKSFSPKMVQSMKDINESPGKVLFYSQFRKVEGIGIMCLVLAQAGWVEIQVSKDKTTGEWYVHGPGKMPAEEVFHAEYDRKRYVLFNSDKEKTEVLMRIFNGQIALMPQSVQTQLGNLGYVRTQDNLRGEKCSLMMVTQSGAEGISLKHVRRVLILEPFWNNVRIEQVIGRAARHYSHVDLPPDDRNVEVLIYMSVFTDEQKKRSHTISTYDGGISSDTHIASIATRKNVVISEFLKSLKSAAIDCAVLAETNRLKDEKQRCYQFPQQRSRVQHSFLPDIEEDLAQGEALSKRMIPRAAKGKVVQTKNDKKKMILLDGKRYDYEAYVHANMLIEI